MQRGEEPPIPHRHTDLGWAAPRLAASRLGSDGRSAGGWGGRGDGAGGSAATRAAAAGGDRKSTRLNSSHGYISYAVFCLKKKKKNKKKLDTLKDAATSGQ